MENTVEIVYEYSNEKFKKIADILEEQNIDFFTEIIKEEEGIIINDSILNENNRNYAFVLSVYEVELDMVVSILEANGVKLDRDMFRYEEDLQDIITDPPSSGKEYEPESVGDKVKDSTITKHFLFGSIWLFGGLSLTAMDLGYVFIGAILYGGYRIIRGITD